MAESHSERRNPNTQLLQELEALSQSLYQSHTARRTASLALPRSSAPPPPDGVSALADPPDDLRSEHRPRSRRLSISPWRSRPKQQPDQDDDDDRDVHPRHRPGGRAQQEPTPAAGEKKGIWNWKPMRALSHIGMQRLGCLFSVEVVSVQGLPASMNGLRLSVAVRKKETKDGAVQTMPSRVLQGCADFEETMFVRCHVYCSGGGVSGKPLKFEPRPFLIYTLAIDAPELEFGKSTVDLSLLVKESMEKNLEGARVRQWNRSFHLAGKAKGGEMVLKLGFQIMEDAGVGIYCQLDSVRSGSNRGKDSSSPFARRQSKSSFSVTSPRVSSRLEPTLAPSNESSAVDFRGIDDFNLDESAAAPPTSSPSVPRSEPDARVEDVDLPEFEVVDKGVEIQAGGREGAESGEAEDEKSASSEVIVKEVVSDPAHHMRLTELDSIAKQIEALESMMTGGGNDDDAAAAKTAAEREHRWLDADEETVTREFLQMLELEDGKERGFYASSGPVAPSIPSSGDVGDAAMAFVCDLGKGLGSVIQTKDGGYLAAMNPFNTEVPRKDTPKLAMQISKPLVLREQKSASGFELFQRMAGMGSEELTSALVSLAAMDDLMGKTAEQIAFEGIASAIISGRNKEGASSSAAKSISAVKMMAVSMGAGRMDRVATGIWNVSEDPVAAEDVLAFALQKIETMAVEALKIQADMAEEESPFDVFTLAGKDDPSPPLASAVPLDEWVKDGPPPAAGLTILVVVQLRDPLRRYETVGAPVVALLQAVAAVGGGGEEGYKVGSLHVGGLRARALGTRGGAGWDGEKQRLTATQWLVAYGLGRAGRKGKAGQGRGAQQQDLLWSMSSRQMAGIWLKQVRNPDVKFPRRP